MTSLRLAIVVAAILPAGCASVAVERAKDLSSAGIQYAHATASVIDVASNAAVDAAVNALKDANKK